MRGYVITLVGGAWVRGYVITLVGVAWVRGYVITLVGGAWVRGYVITLVGGAWVRGYVITLVGGAWVRGYVITTIYLEVVNPIVKLEVIGDGSVSLIRGTLVYGVTSKVPDLQTYQQIHKEVSWKIKT